MSNLRDGVREIRLARFGFWVAIVFITMLPCLLGPGLVLAVPVAMSIAPIYAGMSSKRTALGVVCAASSFALAPIVWGVYLLIGRPLDDVGAVLMVSLPVLASFGSAIGMLLSPRRSSRIRSRDPARAAPSPVEHTEAEKTPCRSCGEAFSPDPGRPRSFEVEGCCSKSCFSSWMSTSGQGCPSCHKPVKPPNKAFFAWQRDGFCSKGCHDNSRKDA